MLKFWNLHAHKSPQMKRMQSKAFKLLWTLRTLWNNTLIFSVLSADLSEKFGHALAKCGYTKQNVDEFYEIADALSSMRAPSNDERI